MKQTTKKQCGPNVTLHNYTALQCFIALKNIYNAFKSQHILTLNGDGVMTDLKLHQ